MRLQLFKFIRFSTVGVANSIIYAISTYLFFFIFDVSPIVAGALGFLTAIPFAFIAHRSFTFASQGAIGGETIRFVIAQIVGLLMAMLAMWLTVDVLGLHVTIGIVAAIVLVPIMSFFILNGLVFRHQTPRH